MSIRVVRPEPAHRSAWEELYAAYARFYRTEQTPDMRARVWSWLQDDQEELEGFLAIDAHGEPVGLAHFREFSRPLSAAKGGFLDDLFVAPEARGSGAAAALLKALATEAQARGWSVVRWITADDNYRARGLYDKLATRTGWVTYDMAPAAPRPD